MKSYISTDYNFGIKSEMNNFDIFKEYFGDESLIQSKSKTALFDYESDKMSIELKTRRVTYSAYKDTMVGRNKMDYCDGKDKDFYFCFSFLDGLYYWKYNKEELHKIRFNRGGRSDRGRYEMNDYAFIPIEMLSKIE